MRHFRGNILFLILLAVVLFAALSYAVTSSMRGGGRDASQENVKTTAASIMQSFAAVDAALMRMQLTGNMKPENISFVYPAKLTNQTPILAYQNNPACTTNDCKLFHTEGGGVAPINFEKNAMPSPTPSSNCCLHPGYFVTYIMQWPMAGTDKNDIVMQLTDMPTAVCNEIRDQLGLTTNPSILGTSVQGNNIASWDNPSYTIGTGADQLIDKTTFTASSGGGRCHIWHLLFAR